MLVRKMLRELKSNAAQFISIFLLVILGMLIYTGLNAIGYGMEQSSTKFYKDCNLSQVNLYGTGFTKEDIDKIASQSGIDGAEGRLQYNVTLKENSKVTLQLNYVEENNISSMYLMEGKPYDQDLDGIWLDYYFAEKNQLHVGDRIAYMNQGVEESKTIQGLIMHPEYVFALKDDTEALPNHEMYGYGLLSAKQIQGIPEISYNQVLLRTNLTKEEITTEVSTCYPDQTIVILMQDEFASVNMFHNEISQMTAVQAIFPAVFLIVAILTILTTMTRITVNQRPLIGIFKALGFSNRKIIFHYVSYGFLLSVVGSVIGTLIGIGLLPELLFSFQKTMYSLPYWNKAVKPYIFVIVGACVFCCSMCGYLACRKELTGVAASILRPKPIKAAGHIWMEHTKWWSKRKFDVQWNIRDLLRNRLRVVITVFGIIGCMALILCGLGMYDTMKYNVGENYYKTNAYQTRVTLEDNSSMEVVQDLLADDEKQCLSELNVELKGTNQSKLVSMTVVGTGKYLFYEDINGNEVELPSSGIAISRKLADQMEVGIGDELVIRTLGTGQTTKVMVNEIVRSTFGQGIFLSKESFEQLGGKFIPTVFLSNQDASNFNGNEYKAVQSITHMVKTMDEMMTMMNTIITIMIAAAALLGGVVLYNLGVLSFYEKSRELATLKVLGFQYGRLAKLLQKQNIWLTVIGIVAGCFVGYGLLNYMLVYMGDSYDMITKISFLSYSISICGTLALSILVNYWLSRKLKTIDMVSALKSVE